MKTIEELIEFMEEWNDEIVSDMEDRGDFESDVKNAELDMLSVLIREAKK